MSTIKMEYNSLKRAYTGYAKSLYSKNLEELKTFQLQDVVAHVIMDVVKPSFEKALGYYSTKRVAVYMSMEFLIGRVELDVLSNTRLRKLTSRIFAEKGIDINVLEDVDDPALGNGGLGRLAACYMESAATLGLPVFGHGLYYKYGLFKQEIKDNEQVEVADDWAIEGDSWFKPQEDQSIIVEFKDTRVKAVPCVMPVIGYNRAWDNFELDAYPLTLWRAESMDGTNESAKKISDYLYPNDKEDDGRKLRIRQEYFFTSALMQRIFQIHKEKHGTVDNIEEYYTFQMNDTHPVLACVEFIRLLEQEGYSFAEAFKKARKCFAYTNHTVLPEALESWRADLFQEVIPDKCYRIIQDLNQKLIDELIAQEEYQKDNGEPDWDKIRNYELTAWGSVHMSRIACFISHTINGVAALHSQILKDRLFYGWDKICPGGIINITNGVTPRRWILESNPALSELLTEELGDGWVTNLELLERLDHYQLSPDRVRKYLKTKEDAKKELARYILKREGIEMNPNSIVVSQVKRFHLYKRQLLFALGVLWIRDEIKCRRIKDFPMTTILIGGKAAASYVEAKEIIKLWKDIQDLVNNDSDMAGIMQVIFLTNYNVSYMEKICAATDISLQISMAGQEASGTGNMKFMMNGAVTVGTMDGANIEIFEKAGIENNYPFGLTVKDLNGLPYNPKEFMDASKEMQVVLPYLMGELSHDYKGVVDKLMYEDKYRVMPDLRAFINALLGALYDIEREESFGFYEAHAIKALKNIAHSGDFSSDRAIMEYAEKIWHIVPEK